MHDALAIPSRHRTRRHAKKGIIMLGIASLLWLLFRTGSKPSRIAYPCQQAALANSLAAFPLLAAILVGVTLKTFKYLTKWGKVLSLVVIMFTSILVTVPYWEDLRVVNAQNPNQEINLILSSHAATASSPSNIFVVNGRQTATASNLVNLMASNGLDFYSMIQSNDVVLIKINAEWDERGGTDTDVLRQLIQAIISHPNGFTGEIVVADNGQFQTFMNGANNNAEDHTQSPQDVADSYSAKYNVSTYDWMPIRKTQVDEYTAGDMKDGYILESNPNNITNIQVSYPKFRTIFGTYISFKNGIWNGQEYENRLKVINMPVLKSHNMYGVTGAVKHYMGVQTEGINGGLANGHESIASGGMGTLMAETRMPTLNILCAIWVNAIPDNYVGAGPSTPYNFATRTNVLAASTDPVALDYWASKYVLVQAAQRIGYSDTHTLDPESTNKSGVATEAFGVWLPKARDALLRAGVQVTTNEAQMNIYVLNPGSPSPSPSSSTAPSPSSTPPPTPTPTPEPTITPTPTPTPTPTSSPQPTSTLPSSSPSYSSTPTFSLAPSPSPNPSSTPQRSPSQSLFPSPSPSRSAEITYPVATAVVATAIIAATVAIRKMQKKTANQNNKRQTN